MFPEHADSETPVSQMVSQTAARVRARALAACALSLLVSCAAQVDPIEACPGSAPSSDPRAVLIRTATGGRCSGAVVGPRTVYTAAHCVDSADTVELEDGLTRAEVTVYQPDTDFAVLHLPYYQFDARDLGGLHPMAVATVAPEPGDALTLIGYGCTRHREARALVALDTGLADGCACHGDSGAGVLNARGELVGTFLGWAEPGGLVRLAQVLGQPDGGR